MAKTIIGDKEYQIPTVEYFKLTQPSSLYLNHVWVASGAPSGAVSSENFTVLSALSFSYPVLLVGMRVSGWLVDVAGAFKAISRVVISLSLPGGSVPRPAAYTFGAQGSVLDNIQLSGNPDNKDLFVEFKQGIYIVPNSNLGLTGTLYGTLVATDGYNFRITTIFKKL